MFKISIIGTGYVGLPTGVGFAELGHSIVCIDNNAQKIADLSSGKITLFEEGLSALMRKNSARLSFTTDISAVKDSDIVIVAVGTPPHPLTKEADLQYIYAAVEGLAPHLSGYTIIANKSTVPVGTCDKINELVKTKNPSADFDVISMPEFLREGFAVYDFFNPERIVVGTDSARARDIVRTLYPDKKILFTDRRSAELIKYASNAFLACKIHYINEMADMCEKVGANVYDVALGMGLDSRIGNKFLNPGPGYGGMCFPKDTNALAVAAKNVGADLSLVNAAISGNDLRKRKMASRILDAVHDIDNPRIAVWGLAFKGGTDDVRESPAIEIVRQLVKEGASLCAYDPKAMENAKEVLGDTIAYSKSAIDAVADADILAVLTEWKDFSDINLTDLKMRNKRIVDLRRMIDPKTAQEHGFQYSGIGIK